MSFDLKLQNGDINISSNGDLEAVDNSDKLIQDILKIVTTELGGNKRFPWYGSPISQSMIGRSFDSVFIRNIATSQLRFSLSTLQALQNEQIKKGQLITPQEQIAAVQNISVDQNDIDPRFFNILLIVLNKAFRRVTPSFSIQL